MKGDQLLKNMKAKDVSVTQLASYLQIDNSTFYRKLQRPDSFSVEQARSIAEFLRLSKDETNSIFFDL